MILIDLILLIFLGVCIYYCLILNKRINELHSSRTEFTRMIKEFDLAIVRAESSIADLTKLSRETSAKIHKTTEKTQFLINDMTFMNDMGSDIANQLEKTIDVAKAVEKRLNLYSANLGDWQKDLYTNVNHIRHNFSGSGVGEEVNPYFPANQSNTQAASDPVIEIKNIMNSFGGSKGKEVKNNYQQLIKQAK